VRFALDRLAHAFRALRHRNFRLFIAGQIVSLSGTWMQQVAVGWLVYRKTGSPLLLGALAFASLFPTLLLAPLAGVWADRVNRHRMIVLTQVLAMAQAFVLAGLVLSGHVHVIHVILLSAFLGLVNGAEIPARQAFLIEMVEGKEDLGSAIALNSSTFNSARLIGPSIAGVLVSWLGEGWVFFWNGVSYLAVVAALLAMRVAPATRRVDPSESVLRPLREGLSYAAGFLPIRRLLLLIGAVALVGFSYVTLLPVFARDVLGGGAHTLGFLFAAGGVGAVAGVLGLASRPSVRGLLRIIAIAVVAFGGSLVGLAFTRRLSVALALLFVAGAGMMVHLASTNTVLQTIVDDDKRGRVMSLFATSHIGMVPLGGLLCGALAERIGAPRTVLLGGGLCLLFALIFWRSLPALRAEIRPVYVRLGIVPASGLAAVEQGLPSAEADDPSR
jgi:MFS family permease